MVRAIPLRFAGALFALAPAATLLAQENTPPYETIAYVHDSGEARNAGTDWEVVLSFPVEVEGAAWLRLFFEDIELAGDVFAGTGSRLRVTALQDGAVQELNAIHCEQWQRSTCYFNGGAVLVEVVAAPGTGVNRVRLDYVSAGLVPVPEESQCGTTDDRVPSDDPRAARLLPVGCTGWLIDDCSRCFLTAGHCHALGGGIDLIEFNVPPSTSSGTIVHPPPEDQYAIDTTSEQWINGGIGNDWGHFGVFANPNTGLSPAVAQGAVYDLRPAPSFSPDVDIRITGFGVDSGTANQTQQTHVGPLATISGTSIGYVTDTQGGNSGSPVIWEQTGEAIGIHCHGGCSSGGGNNWGTTSQVSGLQNAVANPQGVCECGLELLGLPPSYLDPGATATVQIAAAGASGPPALHVRYAGSEFLDVAMSMGVPEVWQAVLPPPVCGAAIEYYFSAPSDTGLLTLPAGAPLVTYQMPVGSPSLVTTDEVETGAGWAVGLPGDDATLGIWKRVDPNGTIAQPEDDHTTDPASICWVTGQGGTTEPDDANDVDGGRTTLLSPVLDLSAYAQPVIGYWRWYHGDGAEVFRVGISDDGGTSFTALEDLLPTDSESGGGWYRTSFLVSAYADTFDQIRLRFQAFDQGGDDLIEAAIDDLEISELACDAVLDDCNGNGILDSDDIASGRSLDVDSDGVPDECSSLGTPVCFGDGSGAACPCGNDSPTAGEGCVHSGGAGMTLAAVGTTSVAADDLSMTASGCPAGNTGIFYVGDTGLGAGAPLYDGLQCAGGDVRRFQGLFQTDGTASDTGFVAQDPSGIYFVAGLSYVFQYWSRDVAGGPSPCATGANFSPAYEVTMTP